MDLPYLINYNQIMRVFRLLLAGILTIAIATPVASAQTGGASYVAFGDSIAANPTWAEQFDKSNGQPCRYGKDSYPEKLAGDFPSFYNASCSGTKITVLDGEQKPLSETFDYSINQAQDHGALGSNTRVVTITIGANDPWPQAMGYGYKASSMSIDPKDYANRIRSRIDRIKSLAPNARILLVGYPEFVDDDNRLCLVNHDGGSSALQLPVDDPTLKKYFRSLNQAITGAANQLGAEYVDIATAFRGHNTCAAGADRWVTTLVDNPGVNLLPMHVSSAGVQAQAQVIRTHLGL